MGSDLHLSPGLASSSIFTKTGGMEIRARGQDRQPEPLAQQQQQQDGEHVEENNEEANVELVDNPENDDIDTPVVEEPKPSRFAVVFTFFSTLVSSIIPEQPQVV